MNYIDVLLVVVVLLSMLSGWNKGFILGLIELLSLAAGLILTFMSYHYLATLLNNFFPVLGVWTLPAAFIITLILIRTLISALVGLFLKSVPVSTHSNLINKSFGLSTGLLSGIIYAIIISALLLATPLFEGLSGKARESQIVSKLTPTAEWIESKFAPVFDEAVKRTITKLTVEPGSEESIKMPFKVTDPKVRVDLEEEMLILVNEERAKEGLAALKADSEMKVVARKHSVDMFARQYFSHVTPDKVDPFERMRREKVRFLTAGENLAYAQTLPTAHRGLMNSPGHRANILSKAFGRVGIGIMDGGMYGLMITQNFRN